MLCKRCSEPISSGEACIPEQLGGSDHFWYFHPECYAKRKEEQKIFQQRIENVRHMAGFTH